MEKQKVMKLIQMILDAEAQTLEVVDPDDITPHAYIEMIYLRFIIELHAQGKDI